MSEYLPNNVLPFVEPLPENLLSGEVLAKIDKFRAMYGDDYVGSIIWTAEQARSALDHVGVQHESAFYLFYQNAFDLPQAYRNVDLYGLTQVRDDFDNPFWGDKYKNIQDRYLLISSVEGEYSYFYDKKLDLVYGVGWNEMGKFVSGELAPLFSSFFDFLDWYFSEEDE